MNLPQNKPEKVPQGRFSELVKEVNQQTSTVDLHCSACSEIVFNAAWNLNLNLSLCLKCLTSLLGFSNWLPNYVSVGFNKCNKHIVIELEVCGNLPVVDVSLSRTAGKLLIRLEDTVGRRGLEGLQPDTERYSAACSHLSILFRQDQLLLQQFLGTRRKVIRHSIS